MSQLTQVARRSQRPAWLAAAALVVALAAFALVWIGRASAEKGGASGPAVTPASVSNVATSRADAVEANTLRCTASPDYNEMPDMSETFTFGGRISRPVIVLFEAEWVSLVENGGVFVRLAIDGNPVGGTIPLADFRAPGEPDEPETHGFNFVSGTLAPGTHTATILWADNGAGPGCVTVRSLIVLHK